MGKILIIMVLFTGQLLAQGNSRLEELSQQVASARSDSTKVNRLCQLSQEYLLSDAYSGIKYAQAAQSIASKINYVGGEAKALGLLGRAHLMLGEYAKAMPYYFSALKIAEQEKDTALLITTHNSLGVLCNKTDDNNRALKHYQTAIALAKKTNNQLGLSKVYNNLGDLYEKKGDYQKSLYYFTQSTSIQRVAGDKKAYAIGLLNLGNTYTILGQPNKGLEILNEALQLDKEMRNAMNMTVTQNSIAKAYRALHHPDSAFKYAQQSYDMAVTTQSSKKIMMAAKLLADLHAAQQDYAKAYHFQQVVAEQDFKLDREQQNRTAAEIVAKYENNKKELENIELKAQQKLQALQLEKQEDMLALTGFILLLLSILVVGLYLSKRHFKAISGQLQEATDLLLLKNQEITAQKEALSQQSVALTRTNALLDRHNSFKNRIFSIVSHDLRSPFNSIQGILQLMQNRTLSEAEVKRIFETLNKNMEVVVAMMNNLLDWSKAQMNGSSLELHPLPLHSFVSQTLDMWQEQAQTKDITLVNELDESLTVVTDKERLAFVLRNLVANALKFSFEGGTVTVAAQCAASGILFTVTDTGKGIPARNLPKLFSDKRFTTPGTHQEMGTGLGLLLCKELIESLGGEITVESEVNQGCRFKVLLPCEIVPTSEKEATPQPVLETAYA